MPFTEKPTKMVLFDTHDGVPFIEIEWQDGKKTKWEWHDPKKDWVCLKEVS